MDCGQIFNEHRNLLFGIAYRMLGLVMDAEDMVQESYIRWNTVCSDSVDSPKSYLTTMMTRLCIDHLRSAKVQREEYIGPWLPSPIFTDTATPEQTVDQHASISMAFLIMLERLNPVERAVFLLREVFDYDYGAIAEIVDKSEAACRQIMRRARQHVDEKETRYTPDMTVQQKLLEQFLELVVTGNTDDLLGLLTDDVISYSDGGGQVATARKPVIGAPNIARFMIGLTKRATPDMQYILKEVNGQLAVCVCINDRPFSIFMFEYAENNQFSKVYAVVNPDKLKHLYI